MARPNYIILFLAVTCLFLTAGGSAVAADTLYTIKNIKVDVTAESAVRAREKGFIQAQEKAFMRLAEQLLSPEELENFETPESPVISSMIKDFEVTNERLSSVRHVGTYTVRFNKQEVRDYLDRSGVSYTDVGRKPMLVLPYYQKGAGFVLWESDNPWRKAWRENESFRGLAPVTVPLGDVQDLSDLPGSEPMSYDREILRSMAARYGAGGTLIILASPIRGTENMMDPDALNVSIYRTDKPRPQIVENMTVKKSDPSEDIFRKAALKAHRALEEEWKSQTLTDSRQFNSLRARISFETMEQWIETHRVLKNVSGISELRLMSLSPDSAQVEMTFHGAERRLRLALAQSDITLTTPRVSFGDMAQGSFGGSPLIYDLYLNKYKPATRRRVTP